MSCGNNLVSMSEMYLLGSQCRWETLGPLAVCVLSCVTRKAQVHVHSGSQCPGHPLPSGLREAVSPVFLPGCTCGAAQIREAGAHSVRERTPRLVGAAGD